MQTFEIFNKIIPNFWDFQHIDIFKEIAGFVFQQKNINFEEFFKFRYLLNEF